MPEIVPPATPPPATPPPATPPPATGDWTQGLSDDHKGYVQNKGFKGPQDVVESYRNFEKLQGVPQDRLLKLPENMETPEGRAIWERLGAPKLPADYGLDKLVPKDLKTAEWAAGVFHETGIPRGAAEKIMTKWNERSAAAETQAQELRANMIAQDDAKLKATWGQAYEQNINLVKAGARALGLDGETLDVLEARQGREKLFTKLHKIGEGVGEAAFIDGRPSGWQQFSTPEAARSRINELNTDPVFVKRYLSGEADAVRQMQNLHRAASPD